jgi:1-aminocyclopropane-1-carboxylate deaminase
VLNESLIIQKLDSSRLPSNEVTIDVLRLDLLHPEFGGNKWFKLKRNLQKAKDKNIRTIITFGGAYSNHIAATAATCKFFQLHAIGIIRGEEPNKLNPTLLKAKEDGMQLHFVTRETFAQKTEPHYHAWLTKTFGEHLLIPEGGNNEDGILGCSDILNPAWNYDYVFCACGTAATFSGIVASCKPTTIAIGISVLKGDNNLPLEVKQQLTSLFPQQHFNVSGNEVLQQSKINNHCIVNTYCFNGYAKLNQELIDFKNQFEKDYNIPLDYVYTNKLFYGVFDLIQKQKLKSQAKILIVHSSGLQGNKGFEGRFGLSRS